MNKHDIKLFLNQNKINYEEKTRSDSDGWIMLKDFKTKRFITYDYESAYIFVKENNGDYAKYNCDTCLNMNFLNTLN